MVGLKLTWPLLKIQTCWLPEQFAIFEGPSIPNEVEPRHHSLDWVPHHVYQVHLKIVLQPVRISHMPNINWPSRLVLKSPHLINQLNFICWVSQVVFTAPGRILNKDNLKLIRPCQCVQKLGHCCGAAFGHPVVDKQSWWGQCSVSWSCNYFWRLDLVPEILLLFNIIKYRQGLVEPRM